MKIDRIVPYLVDNCLLIRVYTDAGLVGTGEAGLWAHHRLVFEAIKDLSDYFIGRDPGAIEHHFQAVTRNAHFSGPILSAALSGIDIALWDILGKSVGKPVHQLLGGVPAAKRSKVFANVTGVTVDEHVDSAPKASRFRTTRQFAPCHFFPNGNSKAPHSASEKLRKSFAQFEKPKLATRRRSWG